MAQTSEKALPNGWLKAIVGYQQNRRQEFEDDADEYELFFSELGGGKILFEAENGVELTYDMMGSAG